MLTQDLTASTFRVFLKDGQAMPAYGESAVVADRVVFSLIIGGGSAPVTLQLVSLPASHVDLERTAQYAKAVRAAYFASTSGEAEYQAVTTDIAAALDSLPAISDPAVRLQVAEEARERLQRWSADHYDYHAEEVRRFIGQFDGIEAQLRASIAEDRVSLNLVAGLGNGRPERILPPMTLRESIEAALFAVGAADEGPTREAVLRTVLDTLDRTDVESDLRLRAGNRLAAEINADRVYAAMTADVMAKADSARLRGDVAAAEALPAELARRDADLGQRRPEMVQALIDALSARLAVTRAYRAALDHYAEAKPQLLAYERRVSSVLTALTAVTPMLERIRDGRALSYDSTTWTLNRLTTLRATLVRIDSPAGAAAVHAALGSVIDLGREACLQHQQSLVLPKMATVSEASAAAAGAVLLLKQARQDLAMLVVPPKPS